ncbi:hypothetical protein GGR50DRAFT_657913 [Xylaria sp. CBS 124048]|nr:hypothetical protein GGR50DRAFT_657913 [Xylaria sp. CBS 124048]
MTRFSAASPRFISPATPRRTYSSRPPRGPTNNSNAVKFWPFLAIIAVGTGAFMYVSRLRAGQGHSPIARNEIPNR